MREGLGRVSSKLDQFGKQLLILTEVPRPLRDLVACVVQETGGIYRRACDIDPRLTLRKHVEEIHGETNGVVYEVVRKFSNASVVNSTDRLCGEVVCETFVNGEYIYRDHNHLRRNLLPETIRKLTQRLDLASSIQEVVEDDRSESKLLGGI
jgi:hypothetical protein